MATETGTHRRLDSTRERAARIAAAGEEERTPTPNILINELKYPTSDTALCRAVTCFLHNERFFRFLFLLARTSQKDAFVLS